MSKGLRTYAAILVFAALVNPIFANAQSVDELQKQIDSNATQIATLEREIAQYQSQLDTTTRQKTTLQNTIAQLDLQRKKLTASVSVTKSQINTTQLQIRQLSTSIEDKQSSIQNDKAGLAESLRLLEREEQQPLAVSVLSSNQISDAWRDADRIAELQESIREDIDRLSTEKQSLTNTKTAAEAKRAQLLQQQQTLLTQQGSLNATRKAQSELLAQTKAQESNFQTILAQKQTEKIAFEAELFELASKLEYKLDPSRIPIAGRGVLRWPLDNVFVTQQFGKTSSSGRLYTSGTHDGIDFRASLGTPVRASLSGVVLEINTGAVQNCQYGKWILIKHDNDLTTLYAHLSDIGVRKGEAVSTGQVIGFSGNTGYATGPHLHFTVYLADAVSFKQYTCKNGRRVTVPIAPINAYLNPLNYL